MLGLQFIIRLHLPSSQGTYFLQSNLHNSTSKTFFYLTLLLELQPSLRCFRDDACKMECYLGKKNWIIKKYQSYHFQLQHSTRNIGRKFLQCLRNKAKAFSQQTYPAGLLKSIPHHIIAAIKLFRYHISSLMLTSYKKWSPNNEKFFTPSTSRPK